MEKDGHSPQAFSVSLKQMAKPRWPIGLYEPYYGSLWRKTPQCRMSYLFVQSLHSINHQVSTRDYLPFKLHVATILTYPYLSPIHTPTKFSGEVYKRVKVVQEVHAHMKAKIERSNKKNKNHVNKLRKDLQFKPRDPKWIHLRKERFPSKIKSKLLPWWFPREYGVFATFNVIDWVPTLIRKMNYQVWG